MGNSNSTQVQKQEHESEVETYIFPQIFTHQLAFPTVDETWSACERLLEILHRNKIGMKTLCHGEFVFMWILMSVFNKTPCVTREILQKILDVFDLHMILLIEGANSSYLVRDAHFGYAFSTEKPPPHIPVVYCHDKLFTQLFETEHAPFMTTLLNSIRV